MAAEMDAERLVEAQNHAQIHAEIERLRAQFPQTQDLYREVCVLLFFRFGITPTANKLYQFVRRGSMSAPAEALARFWATLREKSRVRIEHPDLPEELRTAAGELAATLWKSAQAQAHMGYRIHVEEADAAVLAARGAAEHEAAARHQAETVQAKTQAALADATRQLQEAGERLAAEGATRVALEHQLAAQAQQLAQAGEELARQQAALTTARHEFTAELDQQRKAGALAEERLQAAEARALREIDHERQQVLRLQKELERERAGARQEHEQMNERHQAEVSRLHAAAGELRRQVGLLEGSQVATAAERERLAVELTMLRGQLEEAQRQVATTRAEASHAHAQLENTQQQMTVLQQEIATLRVPRRRKHAN